MRSQALGKMERLGGGDDFRRRDEAEPGVMPADQCLEAGNGARLQIDLRLEPGLDLPIADRRLDILLDEALAIGERLEAGIEFADLPAALALGVVERHVGARQQFLGGGGVGGKGRQAHAERYHRLAAAEGNRGEAFLQQGFRMVAATPSGIGAGHEDGEFVTAEPGDQPVFAHGVA